MELDELTNQPSYNPDGITPVQGVTVHFFSWREKMALTPTIISASALARDPAAALDVQPIETDSFDAQVNAAHPLTKRCHRAVLLGKCKDVETSKPRIAALLRGSIGASLQ